MSAAGPAAGAAADGVPRVQPESRAAWRAWLDRHHGSARGVWLVSFKKGTGRQAFDYGAAVEEALCFGWVDSRPAGLDTDRSMLYFAPRKPGSGWSRPNKERVARLGAAGLLAPAARAAVEAAKTDGSWAKLDAVEDLVVPDDLAAAFGRHAGAAAQWDGFPRSARRGILEWIVQAKRPETRARRVEETARLAARGERANQWRRA